MAKLTDRTELITPADGDFYVTTDISDTTDAATGTDKKITFTNIKAGVKTYTDTLYPAGSGTSTGTNTGDQTNITGNAATVTTNANLTGHVTSTGNAAILGSFTKAQLTTAVSDGDPLYVGDVTTNATHTGDATGSGALTVVALNGTTLSGLATGVLKNTTATGVPFISKVALTEPATAATLTILDNKTLTANNSLTLAGTDATTMTFPTTSASIARTDAANTFTGVQTMTSPAITTSMTTGSTSFTALAGATTLLTIGGTGASASMFAPSTLDATSSITGAIRTSGGISAAKSANIGTTVTVGTNIELGHATDTTLARVAAGIFSVEGEVMNGYATTATAAGTTALTIVSATTQFFTGSSTQTVTLPTTSVIVGQTYRIVNNSTGIVTVQSSGANTIQILGAGMSAIFTAIVATPTTAANWICTLTSFTGQNIAQTASANAATVNIAYVTNTISNNSAATLTVTLPTAGAIDAEMRIVRVLDFSAVAQTITWVNTENSTATAAVTSNGSTTLPITVGFQYNSGTSKWRCIASA